MRFASIYKVASQFLIDHPAPRESMRPRERPEFDGLAALFDRILPFRLIPLNLAKPSLVSRGAVEAQCFMSLRRSSTGGVSSLTPLDGDGRSDALFDAV